MECYEIEQRLLQLRSENARLRKLDERFAELDTRLDAIVPSSSTNSTPKPPTQDKSKI